MRTLIVAVVLASCGGKQSPPKPARTMMRQPAVNELLAVSEFDAIGDRGARSRSAGINRQEGKDARA
jgi:hypothetical protein